MSFSSSRGVNLIGSPWDLNCEEPRDFCLAFMADFRENPSTECTYGGIVGAEGIAIITWSFWGRIRKTICGFKEWKMVQMTAEGTGGLREGTWWSEVPPISSNQHQPHCELPVAPPSHSLQWPLYSLSWTWQSVSMSFFSLVLNLKSW